MTGIGNNFGPRSDMGIKNAQNLQNLQKTDKSGLVGEAQKATAADNSRPEGTTLKTHIIVQTPKGSYTFSDGNDNGENIVFNINYDDIFHYENDRGTIDGRLNDDGVYRIVGTGGFTLTDSVTNE